MNVVEIEINKGEYLTAVFEREGYELNAIPTNCIFDKTVPGLGATHSELIANRNSIIIEPNIPVILGKTEGKKDRLAIYEKTKDSAIEKYLTSRIEFKKIICTPESFEKLRRIADELGINLYTDYFCLFDECEKITQDIDYREMITIPMDYFFLFENKAFVSATPLEMRNPEFERNGFYKLKIKPAYDHTKQISLIVTNRYDATITNKLEELKDSQCICIFINSTNGINKLINHLESRNIHDYKAFCSFKSVLKFKDREIKNSFENLDLPLAKYNFFTSRFFSAVDFYVDKKPDILILTDLNEAKYSKIDPVTNAIQIYGRFRNEFPDGEKFNSLTHVTNIGSIGTVFSEKEIKTYIEESEKVYRVIEKMWTSETEPIKKQLLSDDLKKVTFNQFINDDGSKNYFSIDNFYDNERVKGYYLTPTNLEAAYKKTGHLVPTLTTTFELIGDKELLTYKRLRSNIQIRRLIVETLETLETNKSTNLNIIDYAKTLFSKNEAREKVEIALYTIDAYEKLGSEAIKGTGYKKLAIDGLLKNHKKGENKLKMISEPVIAAIEPLWTKRECKLDEALQTVQNVFNIYGITVQVKFSTLKKFGGVDMQKGKGKEGWVKFFKFQPDFEYNN